MGLSFCPVASATGHVGYATRVQSWTRVAYPTRPVATGHWTETIPKEMNGKLDQITRERERDV